MLTFALKKTISMTGKRTLRNSGIASFSAKESRYGADTWYSMEGAGDVNLGNVEDNSRNKNGLWSQSVIENIKENIRRDTTNQHKYTSFEQ